MTRTFIALDIAQSQRHLLSEITSRMAQELPSLRWVDVAGIHLTLAFLGELTDEELDVATSVAEVAARQTTPFSYRLTRLGIFGLPRRPSVIWVGIEESTGRLAQLHRVLNKELERKGFKVDKRSFSPHLTLCRVKAPLKLDEQQHLQRLLGDTHLIKSPPTQQVTALNMMKSELSRTGAKYTCLKTYALGESSE